MKKVINLLFLSTFVANCFGTEVTPSQNSATESISQQQGSTQVQAKSSTALDQKVAEISPISDTSKQTEQLFAKYGHVIVESNGLRYLGLTHEELNAIFKGMEEALFGSQTVTADEMEPLQKLLVQRETEMIENTKKLGEAFLKAKQSEPGMKKTESGLIYKIIASGDTSHVNDDCVVDFHYEGKLISGKIFDSSYERKEPLSSYVNGLIPGMREALKLIGIGGKIQVYIPSDLAYGDTNVGPIFGGSALDFTIELIKITDPKAAVTKTAEKPIELKKEKISPEKSVEPKKEKEAHKNNKSM